ncbi:MAG: FKBP-type peptidyl-prolyl cis-trans isomerase [Paraprevotella sp.]|nr:FKBP-type peptidyl-prolyl cis-trans isomerase [Paraprevotella sp.]
MKKSLWYLMGVVAFLCVWTSCKEESDTYDAYANWPSRNAEYFTQIAAEARDSIALAKALYGDQWEGNCRWRMFKSTTKSPSAGGSLTDSICVYIEKSGTGTESPTWSDTVRVNYRGYLMPTQNQVNGEWVEERKVFSQSFMGDLDNRISVPVKMGVSTAVPGFATALQYMHKGDVWWVYIPSDLAYGSQSSGAVLPYSTLTFYTNLVDFYEPGETIPDWK